jgi:hypothetical protein
MEGVFEVVSGVRGEERRKASDKAKIIKRKRIFFIKKSFMFFG